MTGGLGSATSHDSGFFSSSFTAFSPRIQYAPFRQKDAKHPLPLPLGEVDETKHAIMEYCRKYVAKYAMPYDIEFRDELPKTLVGKVAYRVLEEEELKKLQEAAPVE